MSQDKNSSSNTTENSNNLLPELMQYAQDIKTMIFEAEGKIVALEYMDIGAVHKAQRPTELLNLDLPNER